MRRTKWTCLAGFFLIFGLFSFLQAAEIHQAAEAGDLAKVKALVEKDPALIKAKDENGRTPLHFAAQGEHLDVLRYLVDKGADLNVLDDNGIAPLLTLAARGQTEAAHLLIDKGADIDIKNPVKQTPLNLAAEYGLEGMVKLLIDKGANIENKHAYGRTPLVGAARERGNINVIRMLLDAGADINSSDKWGETALDLAAWRGFEEVVNLLLERGAALPDAPAKIRGLLQNAAEKGLTGLFSRIVEKGADLKFPIDDEGTLLHAAASGGAVPILETLLTQGLDINRQDGNGWLPLHFAAEMGRGEAVSFLLGKKADINARTLMGQTAYNIAEENGNPDVARALAEKGADRHSPRFPELKGPNLGQGKPSRKPEVFAPGIVSGRYGLHSNIAFSPDGREAFWSIMIPPRGRGYGSGKTLVSRQVEGRWTYPVEAVFGGIPLEDVPIFHPDGTKLYDIANRALSPGGKPGKENIWEWEKTDGAWGLPRVLDEVINNNSLHWQFGVDRKGNIYLTLNIPGTFGESDIYCSRLVDGRYLKPENLGSGVNSSGRDEFPFIDPDGAYLLFVRNFDIYVSFREGDGKWGEAKPLGPEVNTRDMELLPMVSPDGRHLFFSRNQDSYWVDAGIIGGLKPEKAVLPQAEDEIPIEAVRLSDRVLVLKEDVMGNNITAIASRKGLIVVDTSGYLSTAKKVRGIIEKEFNRKDFAFVINTHFHWDHAWGNQAFPEATIIGHADCPSMMDGDREYVVTRVQNLKRRLEEQKNKLAQADPDSVEAQNIRRSIRQTERDIKDHSEDFVITPPQVTFNDRMTWDLGDLTLKMYFFGRAHSGTDIFIHIPEEGILLTGDIFLDRRWLPLFAGQPELDIPKWIEVLQAVLDGQDKLTQVIPGHLDLWTSEKLALWRDYIVALWNGLQKAKAEGLGFEEEAARLPLGEKYFYLRENGHSDARIGEFHRGNLEAFWSQLVESAARLVQDAILAEGTESGMKKFAEIKTQKGRYFVNERQFNSVGYRFLTMGRTDDAVAIFKMNVELFPESWNVYDSLAEAYAGKGDTGLAIQNYERSLELNPDNQNAKAQLKNLKKE
ncbi:MAG TPA: ankyrin repeat domain-containing protein [Candidatus Desulfaltia sp.]|nr:ankyrin repeat domain-containing protein [Candidatus Desulfaltia sp.]